MQVNLKKGIQTYKVSIDSVGLTESIAPQYKLKNGKKVATFIEAQGNEIKDVTFVREI